jgi:hypothetical protein
MLKSKSLGGNSFRGSTVVPGADVRQCQLLLRHYSSLSRATALEEGKEAVGSYGTRRISSFNGAAVRVLY